MVPLIQPELDAYLDAHTSSRPPLFDELRERTQREMDAPQMQVGKVEGTLLRMLARLSRAKDAIEIGTFTGYSALCLAEGLAPSGTLITCDIDERALAIAREFFARSPVGERIDVRMGDALQTLEGLPLEEQFDLAFLDADKTRYADYFDALVPRMRSGGLIIGDNALWSGRVLTPSEASDHGIVRFNQRVHADDRVDNVLLPVRDGIMLAQKR